MRLRLRALDINQCVCVYMCVGFPGGAERNCNKYENIPLIYCRFN